MREHVERVHLDEGYLVQSIGTNRIPGSEDAVELYKMWLEERVEAREHLM